MVQRRLGPLPRSVAPLAFGAFKIGRNQKVKYDQAYDLPDDAAVSRLLNGVLDLGINLIDTAPAYGISEERIGQQIGHRRGEFVLSTKVGETFANGESTYDFSGPAVADSVHRSLKRLRTDVLDLVFIHSDGRDLHILQETDTVPTLQRLKQQGVIRGIGLSGKTVEGAQASLAWADALMVEYHPLDTSHEAVIADAGRKGLAVLVKKPLAAGKIPAARAIPFLLANPHVTTLVVGGLNLDHIRENLALATLGQ